MLLNWYFCNFHAYYGDSRNIIILFGPRVYYHNEYSYPKMKQSPGMITQDRLTVAFWDHHSIDVLIGKCGYQDIVFICLVMLLGLNWLLACSNLFLMKGKSCMDF